MNDVTTWLFGALGAVMVFAWLFVIVLVGGLIAFAGRRRALRRGAHPLHLLPWYLGGPPKVDVDLPDDKRSSRERARHP
jgi:hypothetical protein